MAVEKMNCRYCGAPHNNRECAYCGTVYSFAHIVPADNYNNNVDDEDMPDAELNINSMATVAAGVILGDFIAKLLFKTKGL